MSRFCVNCGTRLPDEAGFCPKCGTKIEIPSCPACGKEVDYESDFCIYCGSRLRPEPEPELEKEIIPEPVVSPRSDPVRTPPVEDRPQPQANPEPRQTDSEEKTATSTEEKEKRYLVVCRHPNPRLSLFVKMKYDIILGAEKLTIQDHKENGAASAEGKEIRYADLLFAEIDRVMNHWNLIICLALGWLLLLGSVMHPDKAIALFPFTLVVAFMCWTMYMPRIKLLYKNGEYEYISGRGKSHMSELCADIQKHITAQPDHWKAEKLSEIVEKKVSYYLPQFEKLEQGGKAKFNWAALFFNGGFFYYRKCGKAFWRLFGSFYIFAGVSVAVIAATCGAAMKSSENAELWWLGLGVVSLTTSIYSLICMIRGGKRFNGEYYQQCLLKMENQTITEKEKGTSIGKAIVFLVVVSLCAGLLGGVCGGVISRAVFEAFMSGMEDPIWSETENPTEPQPPIDTENPTTQEIRYEDYIVDENICLNIENWTEICVNIKYWDEKYDSTVAFAIFDVPDYADLESKTTFCHEALGLTARDAVLGFTADGQHICLHRGDQFPIALDNIPYDIVDVFRILDDESDTVQEFAMGAMHYMNMLYSGSASADPAYDAATVICLRDRGFYSFKHIPLSTYTLDGQEPLPASEKAVVLQRAVDLREQLRDAGDSEVLFDQLMNQYSQESRDENGNLYNPEGYIAAKGEMISEVEAGARALWINEISEPVESAYAYHIILRTEPDWASIITEIRAQLYAENSQPYITPSNVDVSELVGVWQDIEDSGNYLFIGYGDSTMKNAYAYVLMEDGVEVELTDGSGDYASGLIMSGSRLVYSIEIARYKTTLEVSIYTIGKYGLQGTTRRL